MVVTDARILGSDCLHVSSPTLVLILARRSHSAWCRVPVLHSMLHNTRLHLGQDRGEDTSRKQLMHWLLDLEM